ncbi:Uncharacterised protein [Mycolicibacterium phlei]|uniref:hypothetical protein n=1 Tax=Mycobacteroides chelonae TaxID=1774 RepID=UPI000618B1A6|nr:hypothetical protein [Mycobacteroides chelonae]VEG18985.1 Uncharacterised protein [Mycolicibacterium phlei]AKC39914.1 hypothetical protein GR01_17010 [Mycobacteroides chelonae]ANB00960.1 hypothetical protein BB28_17905 [Mycobacteroides chelonae CCUG 47445]OLT82683.1 hypothetical protein BKG56_11750 [Mycobacteroides chelonae]ORV16251.1 hypothetical protein AWB96_09845 [Mycobacteroides chelonae]
MSILDTVEPWLKGAVGPAVGYGLGLATPYGRKLLRLARKQPDLQIHVEHDPAIIFANAPHNTVGCPMFVPGSTDSLNPGGVRDAFSIRQWAVDHDGIPAGTDSVEVTLTAWEEVDAIVDAVTVNCREISIPAGIIVSGVVGGASIERRRLDIELSSFGPCAKYVAVNDDSTNFSFKLSSGGTAKIYMNVIEAPWSDERERAYEWTVDLHLLVNNKRRSITIGDNGKPFEFVRAPGGATVLWTGSGWQQS